MALVGKHLCLQIPNLNGKIIYGGPSNLNTVFSGSDFLKIQLLLHAHSFGERASVHCPEFPWLSRIPFILPQC